MQPHRDPLVAVYSLCSVCRDKRSGGTRGGHTGNSCAKGRRIVRQHKEKYHHRMDAAIGHPGPGPGPAPRLPQERSAEAFTSACMVCSHAAATVARRRPSMSTAMDVDAVAKRPIGVVTVSCEESSYTNPYSSLMYFRENLPPTKRICLPRLDFCLAKRETAKHPRLTN